MAVMGTIELGKVVKRGLEAERELTGGKILDPQRKAIAMRDYLSMKALEQALAPHVAAHQDAIETGEGPLSSIQLLMGDPGFSARNIHRMVSWSEAMAEFLARPADKLPALLRQEGKMALLGQRAMAACYDSDLRGNYPAREQSCAEKGPRAAKGPVHPQSNLAVFRRPGARPPKNAKQRRNTGESNLLTLFAEAVLITVIFPLIIIVDAMTNQLIIKKTKKQVGGHERSARGHERSARGSCLGRMRGRADK